MPGRSIHSTATPTMPSYPDPSLAFNAVRESTPATVITDRFTAELNPPPAAERQADAMVQSASIAVPLPSCSHHASAISASIVVDSQCPLRLNAQPSWEAADPDMGSDQGNAASSIRRTAYTGALATGDQARQPVPVAELPAIGFARHADTGRDNWLDWLSDMRT